MPSRRRFAVALATAAVVATLFWAAPMRAAATIASDAEVWVGSDLWYLGPLELVVLNSQPLEAPVRLGSIQVTATAQLWIIGSPVTDIGFGGGWRLLNVETDTVLEPGARLRLRATENGILACTDPTPDPCQVNAMLFRKATVLNR